MHSLVSAARSDHVREAMCVLAGNVCAERGYASRKKNLYFAEYCISKNIFFIHL